MRAVTEAVLASRQVFTAQDGSQGILYLVSSDTDLNQAQLTTHFLAAVLAYTKLEVLKLKCGTGHFRLKAQLYAVGLKAMYQQLAQLSA